MMFSEIRKKASAIGIVLLHLSMACFYSCHQTNNPTKNAHTKQDSLAKKQEPSFTNCVAYFTQAKILDSTLLTQTDIDNALANKAIQAFTDFAYYCKTDSMAPVYLIKTAQVARAINNIPQAKKVLEYCIENHKTFKDRAAAMFLLAQLYDEKIYLNNEKEALKLYQQIIEQYPKSPWAESAEGAIAFLGKSDEEIIRQLKNKK